MHRQGWKTLSSLLIWMTVTSLYWLTGCAAPRPDTPPHPENLHCQPVPHLSDTQLCYQQPDFDYPTWYLLRGDTRQKVFLNTQGFSISSLNFSPSGKQLAVLTTGEGHPLLDVYDSSQILEKNDIYNLNSWDPYPGWISVSGWDGETLLLEADVPLHKDYERSGDHDETLLFHFRWSPGAEGLRFAGMEQNPYAEVEAFPTIYFAYDSLEIAASERVKLKRLAERLKEVPNLQLSIEGHTASIGTADYNIDKGDRMAATVQAYLESLGADHWSLRTTSFGEERPIASNDTEAGRALNRRVEILVWDGL